MKSFILPIIFLAALDVHAQTVQKWFDGTAITCATEEEQSIARRQKQILLTQEGGSWVLQLVKCDGGQWRQDPQPNAEREDWGFSSQTSRVLVESSFTNYQLVISDTDANVLHRQPLDLFENQGRYVISEEMMSQWPDRVLLQVQFHREVKANGIVILEKAPEWSGAFLWQRTSK